jgi:polysaccharide export outer membrane protein
MKTFMPLVALSLALVAGPSPLPGRAGDRAVPQTAPAERPGAPAPSGDYTIGPEDLLYIGVWKNEPLSRQVPVRPDGMISIPLVNDVRAAGLTPMQLRDVLVRRLSDFMPNPEVSVIVQEVHSPKVSVLGEVAHPGRFDLRGRTTVLDLLALAGGLTEFASRSRIVILRNDGSQAGRIRFDYDKAMQDGAQTNFELRPGDIVLVR